MNRVRRLRRRLLPIGCILYLLAGLGGAQAAARFVVPGGIAGGDGSNWDLAFTNIQQAIDAAPGEETTLYLKAGFYTNAPAIVVHDHPGLTLLGGYTGSGLETGGVTVLTRDPAATNRILFANSSTLTVERVAFSNGCETLVGAGLLLSNCTATLTACDWMENRFTPLHVDQYGGAIHANACTLTIRDSRLRGNGSSAFQNGSKFGGGLYGNACTLFLSNVSFSLNLLSGWRSGGAGLCLDGGQAEIRDCSFATNTASGNGANGGAIQAARFTSLTLAGCGFGTNVASASTYPNYGGAVYIDGGTTLTVSACTFQDNRLTGPAAGVNQGGSFYLKGAALQAQFGACRWNSGNGLGNAREELYLEAAGAALAHSTLGPGNAGNGITKSGTGSLLLTNCLVHSQFGHGLHVVAGAATIAQSTLADNVGWGLTNDSPAPLTVRDSILWGNGAGGLAPYTNRTVSYTVSQESQDGTGNLVANPRFIAGYYLSANGLPYQSANSPCIGIGSDTAAALGLAARTTRTDGAADSDQVDLGYHPVAGISSASNLFLYVDVAAGSDANSGWTPDAPLKTLTRALSQALKGSTLTIATGEYNAASGEVFPLPLQDLNLTVKGTNRADTVVNAGGAQAFSAGGQRLWMEGLTISNGFASAGPALYANNSFTILSNCMIVKHGGAAAVYARNGAFSAIDSAFHQNAVDSSGSGYGGGLGTLNAAVSLIRVDFVQNSTAPWQTYGGALSLSGGQAWIADCLFSSNKTLSGGVNRGGALYASTVAPLHIENSRFLDNAISGGAYAGGGGALKLEGVEAGMVTGCTFQGNYSLPRKGVALNRGSVIHTSGSGTLAIRDCAIRASPTLGLSSEELYLEPTAALSAVNTELQGGLSGDGIVKEGAGSLALSNCLVYAHPSNGVRVAAGTVSLVNCTIASNGYWGVTNGAGTVAALNCIAWTNGLGGFTANCDLTYTCSQETHAGAGNRPDDPLFAGPATNNFRLTRSSPCVNAGWNGDWTKADRDLDGLPRLNAAAVDLGAYECQLPSGGTLVVVR